MRSMKKRGSGAVHRSADRAYRTGVAARTGETAFQAVVEQSDLWIVAGLSGHSREELRDAALEELHAVRGQLKAYLALHPEFGAALTPLALLPAAPPLVRAMAEAGQACGVGPMAAVAGSVAQSVATALRERVADVLVENGGDLYMYSTRERRVALLADPASGARLGLRLESKMFPLSVCSSSSTIGHSLSLGRGELVTVLADGGALADAAATALCNMLNSERDLDRVLETAQVWAEHGVRGVFAQAGGKIAAWGAVELITI
jgi:ApbE superfamily uncharacterized protein (UPF0280 family)